MKEEKEKQFVYSDSITNVVKFGDIELRSPSIPISELINHAKEIIKDKVIKSYLEDIKIKRFQFGRTLFG